MTAPTPPEHRVSVFVPGNPGDLRFVSRFLATARPVLEGQGDRARTLLAFEHLRLDHPPETMLPYAAHHAEHVKAQLGAWGVPLDKAEIELVGYSVGAYLTYLIVAHDLLPVARVRWLFPFVMRPRPSGLALLGVYRQPAFYRDFLALWRRAPARATRWVVERVGAGEHADWVHDTLRSADARAYFVMAAAEAAEIARRSHLDDILALPLFRDPARFRCLTTPNDRWVPDAALAALRPFSDPLERPVSHDFVLHQAECEVVARALARAAAVASSPSGAVAGA
jgi:hypothetical protein